jgi:preprotein translocase subunit SecE
MVVVVTVFIVSTFLWLVDTGLMVLIRKVMD